MVSQKQTDEDESRSFLTWTEKCELCNPINGIKDSFINSQKVTMTDIWRQPKCTIVETLS